MQEVKQERTGWRDLRLSERHRMWGWNCPAVDLDFLFLEYDRGQPVALVEYKHERALPVNAAHPTYQAMINLGTRAGIPVLVARYTNDFSTWTITPLNKLAKASTDNKILTLSEREWVAFLYKLRGYTVPEELLNGLDIVV